MDSKHYVLSERDRRVLDKLHSEDKSAPPPAMLPPALGTYLSAPDVYWALPPCETGLPAATRLSDGSVRPGVARCCLYRSDDDLDKLVPVLDPSGIPFRIEVRNHYFRVANDYVQVWRHKNGTWTNERPEVVAESTATTTTASPDSISTVNPRCQGECIWIGGTVAGGVAWKPVVGGCANTTTTTTTTVTSTTTTTTSTTTSTTTTTAAPCESTKCMLRCVAATTTSPPGGTTSWPPAPSTGYIYQVIGTACNAPCNCFGAGDPCYLLNGEIESRCVYTVTTTPGPTTTTTTGGPIDGPQTCNIANNLLGVPAAGTYRTATVKGYAAGWIICQDCPNGDFPLFPRGSIDSIDPDPNGQVVVHDSPCGRDPCGMNSTVYTQGKAIYRAFSLSDQQWFWGNKTDSDQIIQYDDEKWLANWRVCQQCGPGLRPANPPSPWLFYDSSENQNGVSLSQTDGMYLYETSCVAGPPCDVCELAHVGDLLGTTTSTTASPTPRPTTTQPPCGCEPPTFCPSVANECVRTQCRPGGAALGTPACPTTTTGPNQCWDAANLKICVCGSTTTTTAAPTTTPSCNGGGCSRIYLPNLGGWREDPAYGVTTCGPSCFCEYPTTTTPSLGFVPSCGTIQQGTCKPNVSGTTSPPCTSCRGTCKWASTYDSATGGYKWFDVSGTSACKPTKADGSTQCQCPAGTFNWGTGLGDSLYYCQSNDFERCCCGCKAPDTPPRSICDLTETPCIYKSPTECQCCTTQACDKYCSFKGNGTGGWTKIDDPCPTTCPCPAYPPTASQSDCDLRRYACGSVVPTTTASPTTSTTTTTPGPGACCFGGGCEFIPYQWCQNFGGTFQGAGVTCASVSCPTTPAPTTTQQYGACCYSLNGQAFCQPGVSRSWCDYVQSDGPRTWHSGQTCAQANCIPTTTASPVGRCCFYFNGIFQWCADSITQASCSATGFGAGWSAEWAQGQTCSAGCPTTTTTTTTTTTVTVAPTTSSPCSGSTCSYIAQDSAFGIIWTLVSACLSPCNCPSPSRPPAFEGDEITLNCVS